MSKRKRKASSTEEPVCVLCGRADVNPDAFGHMLSESGIHVHEFCLGFANINSEARPRRSGTEGLPVAAIRRAVKQATKQQCFVCGERGATITCVERSCERSFHLPCATDGECVTHFFGNHWTFCWEHRPQQDTHEAPPEGTNCLICLEPVEDSLSYHTLVCPACQHAWFHRGCIQQQAVSAGALWFHCAACRDNILFFAEMAILGIQIPYRRPGWVDDDTYEALLHRHSRCDASECLYHGGREQAERRGPWQLLLCSSCAAEGTHRQCSHLSNTTATWECDGCAGLGTSTASSANTELAGPSTAGQTAPEPSSSSMEPETLSSMPTSQAALGTTSQGSQQPEHSDLPSVPETEQETNGPRSSEDRATSEQLRGQTAASSAQNKSHTSTRRRASGSSRASPAAARRRRPRQRGRSRTRSRSPLQARTPSSQSRPRRRRGSRQTPAPGEQSGTRRSTRSATSRSPRASRVPGRRGPSRQRRRTRTQSPPAQRRRAQNSRSSPQRGSRSRAQQRRPSRE